MAEPRPARGARRLALPVAALALALAASSGRAALAGPMPTTSRGFAQAWHDALDGTRVAWRSFAGYGVDTSFGLGDQWWVVTFWKAHGGAARTAASAPLAFFGAEPPGRFVAKRLSGRGRGGAEDAPKVEWADSTRCRGFADQLLRIESLQSPWIDVPGAGRTAPEPKVAAADGADIHVWGRGPSAGTRANVMVELSGSESEPVGAWARDMDDVLRLCWTAQAPAGFR